MTVAIDSPAGPVDRPVERRRYSYELIAIWLLWLLNALWFFPYAFETALGILRTPV